MSHLQSLQATPSSVSPVSASSAVIAASSFLCPHFDSATYGLFPRTFKPTASNHPLEAKTLNQSDLH